MLGRRPDRRVINGMRKAIEQTSLKYAEKETVLKLWRDFKWRMKILDGGYRDVQALCDEFIVRVSTEISHEGLKAEVIKRFEQMRLRASEFTTEEGDTDEGAEPSF